jgi:heme oxygenase
MMSFEGARSVLPRRALQLVKSKRADIAYVRTCLSIERKAGFADDLIAQNLFLYVGRLSGAGLCKRFE